MFEVSVDVRVDLFEFPIIFAMCFTASVNYCTARLLCSTVYSIFQASHGQHFSGDPSKVSALQQMLRIVSLNSQRPYYIQNLICQA